MTRKRDADAPAADRGLPANNEAEKAVLGAILVHNATLDTLAGALAPSHFFRDAHQRIYAAMVDLHASPAAIDFVTLNSGRGQPGISADAGSKGYAGTGA